MIIRAHFHGVYSYGRDFLVDSAVIEELQQRSEESGFEVERNYGYYRKAGYTDQALRGSVAEGFKLVRISENYAKELEEVEPLPDRDKCEL